MDAAIAMPVLDSLIGGGGPAGLTAAIDPARFRRSFELIAATAIHNTPGCENIE